MFFVLIFFIVVCVYVFIVDCVMLYFLKDEDFIVVLILGCFSDECEVEVYV